MATGAETIGVRFSKWDGAPHWRFDMERLGVDEQGFVKVITPNGWWTAVHTEASGVDMNEISSVSTPDPLEVGRAH